MGVFANVGVPDGTLSHYVAVDASHGVVTVDTDDVAGVYRNILNYTQWIEYEINVMLTVDDAVPHISGHARLTLMACLGQRDCLSRV